MGNHNQEDDATEQRPRLTGKQRAFVNFWFGQANFNGTEAARLAGYAGNDNALAVRASETLRNRKVQAEIERRWAAHGLAANEVLSRLAAQARASIGDFLKRADGNKEGEESDGGGWYLDLEEVQRKGHLVKSIQWTKFGPKLDMYDAQGALQLIGKHLGLFAERVEHTGKDGGPIETRRVVPDLGDLTDDELRDLVRLVDRLEGKGGGG